MAEPGALAEGRSLAAEAGAARSVATAGTRGPGLYARLAFGLIVLVLALSALSVAVTLHAGRLYLLELNQRLNQELAANLIAGQHLRVREGQFDREALDAVFHTYMVVNPSIEVYLLNPQGRVLAYSAPPGKVKRQYVDIEPVHAFLHERGRRPILGDDPRQPGEHKVFSVAPVGPPDDPQGYLYVVLAGEQQTSIASTLQGSYILRLWLVALGTSASVAVLVGLLLLRLVTRRLRTLDRALQGFEAENFERFVPPPDLDTRSRDELGRLGGAFVRMAEQIIAQVRALKRTDALRRELVANVSHDLRTPIASLQGYLETLRMKEAELSEEDRRQYLDIAVRHGERLGTLVAELFELAKLDAGPAELQPEPFHLAELVQDVALKFRLRAGQAGVEIVTHIAPDLPFVRADIGLIERVLENLLENALRHTPAGGRIDLQVQRAADRVGVQVADTGEGISPEELPHVFDRFYQSRKGEGRGGAGLGLAIAKRILDLHASPIGVESPPGGGTRFDFSLPACR